VSVRKGNHCAYQIHYHIVFPVKYRKALIDSGITKTIKETIKEIEERYSIEIEQLGCDSDHIHILCGAHPKYAPGQIVRVVKSITARELFKEHPGLKKELWGGEFWTDGYYVGTVGEKVSWSVVENYVRKQGYKPEEIQLRLL